MTVSAAGPMSIALDAARTLVASCASFISRTEAANAAAAKAFAFIDDRPNANVDADGDTPAAPITTWATVFEFAGDTEYEVTRLKAEHGSTLLSLFSQRPADHAASRVDALMDFRNFAGQVITELLALAKTSANGGASFYLGVTRVRQIIPATWCEPINEDETAPFLMATFLLHWV